jgi:ferredoxin-NADP reductase
MVLQRRLRRWQLALFRREGELWLEREAECFDADAAVCKCTGVNRGTLTRAVAQGYDTLPKLAEKTGASQVCGSCAPVLAEILGHSDMELADLVGIIPVTKEVKSFRFRLRSGDVLPHWPGQNIRLEAPIGGRWIQRSYTLTSSCRQSAYYEITVKREPQGLMSCWLHDDLTEQSLVRISSPHGRVHLEAEDQSDVVCFSGGIGITPALAMLRFFAAAQPASRVLHIDYSVSDAGQVVYPEELRKAMDKPNIRVNIHISTEGGRLQIKDVADIVAQYPGARFFICGPRSYEGTVAVFLRKAGVGDERIGVERFTPAGMLPQLEGSKVLLSTSLLTLAFAFAFFCLGPLAPPASIEVADFSVLWRDFLWQQVSGYTVLGLGVSSLLMSLRKRVPAVRHGRYAGWRLFHVAANILALVVLATHTGLSLGSHFNLMLMLCFLGLVMTGGLSGGLIFLEQRLPSPTLHRIKSGCQYAHIAFGWPLTALMGVHIAAAYFFGSGP